MSIASELSQRFQAAYDRTPRLFSAPGRVNLIGEHTDYNDGFVLPMAIERRTWAAAAPRTDGRIRCASTAFPEPREFVLDDSLRPAGDWADYVRGVAAMLRRAGHDLRGADLLIASDVPLGSGLSSSAALEVSTGTALLGLIGAPLDRRALALLCQTAEHEFAGTQCGIMDQYISCLGVDGHALHIDCRSLDARPVPLPLADARIVICNSMVRHELASGEYNRRRAECEEAVQRLAAHLPGIRSLRDVELEDFDLYADALPEIVRRRANHVLTENARTLAAVDALAAGDLATFGRLMTASHGSLRDDYDVSCRELDLLVEIALRLPGVYGARMTGGGFGGSTVNLVAAPEVDAFLDAIRRAYAAETGVVPDCIVSLASAGAREDV